MMGDSNNRKESVRSEARPFGWIYCRLCVYKLALLVIKRLIISPLASVKFH